ncbi:hypothetical protein [Burkholderia sp. AW49-1]
MARPRINPATRTASPHHRIAERRRLIDALTPCRLKQVTSAAVLQGGKCDVMFERFSLSNGGGQRWTHILVRWFFASMDVVFARGSMAIVMQQPRVVPMEPE